jgi:toxin ParE1/3/4
MEVRYLDSAREEAGGAAYAIGSRRLVLPRFPYNLVYEVHDDLLLIVAVAHQRRHPDYWRRRRT